MKQYTGTKTVNATPMSRLEYNNLRGWTVPADENPEDPGYLVEYTDGGKANHPQFSGYISWSPKDVFERAYHPATQNAAAPQDGTKVQGYRSLTADDIAQMNDLKNISRDFCEKLDIERTHLSLEIVDANSDEAIERTAALRCLAIARTKMQEACMWACRAVARPDDDC